ncbi:hypothetical protein OIU74_003638 [Salix koriyanagi]|uniref:Uncharacterized protein n=1 Tax=Salix koriyanagi TaxID=2511006 RepID=A0A9Q0UZ26_9ROSI|nr:hypothetical protein OIU74_003638 [Salix koriyanagi]
MTSTTMGPPPPRTTHPTASNEAVSTTEPESDPESKTSAVDDPQEISSTTAAIPSMGPPPPTNPIPTPPEASTEQEKEKSKVPSVPYTIPEWSGPPCHKFSLEILKDGSIIDQFEVGVMTVIIFITPCHITCSSSKEMEMHIFMILAALMAPLLTRVRWRREFMWHYMLVMLFDLDSRTS